MTGAAFSCCCCCCRRCCSNNFFFHAGTGAPYTTFVVVDVMIEVASGFWGVTLLFQDGTFDRVVDTADGLFEVIEGCEPNDRLWLNVNDVGLTVDFTECVTVGWK